MNNRIVTSLCVLCASLCAVQMASAQGSLTPPGAPAPTMKSLAQVEPRTAITNLPYTITQPGSYYVTTNLSGIVNGITIAADGVTIDLMGFSLANGSGDGISVSGSHVNIAVRNGTINGWGLSGLNATNADNAQYQDLRLRGNQLHGLASGQNCTVVNCTAINNDGNTSAVGILTGAGCTVRDCIAGLNFSGIITGNGSTVKDCTARANGGYGVTTGIGSTVSGCTASGNDQGIHAGDGSTVSGCTADANGVVSEGDGISVGPNSTVSGCTTRANSGYGLATDTGCTVSSCSSAGNFFSGISVDDGSTVIGCSASSNNYGIVATSGCIVKDCQTSNNTGDGIYIGNGFGGTTIRGCNSRGNLGDGIEVYNSCLVVDNTCDGNSSGAGIHVTGLANRIENNQSSSNSKGIGVDGGGNLIIRNSCSSNTTNYSIAANNKVGVTLIPPNSGAVVGNTGGSGASTDPSANYSY
jgi:parallel beta-helix repeat protein